MRICRCGRRIWGHNNSTCSRCKVSKKNKSDLPTQKDLLVSGKALKEAFRIEDIISRFN